MDNLSEILDLGGMGERARTDWSGAVFEISGPEEFSAQVGPARENFRPESARPGPEEFSARVGPAQENFEIESARPGPGEF